MYLSPACILSTLATALIRGEWTQLFEYAEGQEEEGEGKEDKKDEKKDKKPVEKKAVKADKAAKAEKEKPADKSLSPEKMDKGKAVAKTGSHASLPATPAPGSPAQLNKRGRAKAKAEAGTATPARTEPSQPFKEVDVSVKEMAMFRFKNQGPSRN